MGSALAKLKDQLDLAEGAARRAGEVLVRAKLSGVILVAEPERDVRLAADRTSENCIVHALRERSDLAIVSEESGPVENGRPSRHRLRWIVDPLDGSLNFWRGIPLCCVSIGLWDGDRPLLGVVYDVIHREMFTGITGLGARLNGLPIHVSDIHDRDRAVLCTGFPISTDFSFWALANFVMQVRQYKKVRLLGSAALSLAYVASGRVDAYYERDIRLWDVAAGLAIVSAAGGQVLRKPLERSGILTVYAGNSSLPRPHLNEK